MSNFLIKIIYLIELYFIIVVMFSCSMETYSVKKTYADNQIMSYVSENHYNVSADSLGLVYIPITEGNGHYPHHGDIVAFHYIGYFLNGEKFDSSYDRGEPLEFVCGTGMMIRGFDEAVANMEVDLPPVMIENRIAKIINELDAQLKTQGMDIQKYMAFSGMDMDKLRENYGEQAKKDVLTEIMIERVAATEKISEEETAE